MKTKEQIEKIRDDLVNLTSKVLDESSDILKDDEEGLMEIAEHIGKLAILNYVLDDSDTSFHSVREKVENDIDTFLQKAAEESLMRLAGMFKEK